MAPAPGTLTYREPDGPLFDDDQPFYAPVIGLIMEPIDWLFSTGVAVHRCSRPTRMSSRGRSATSRR
ncbi:MAG: hypothetical protein IPK26_25170 [Planctomycetes bacterium]|nr:hypothetical protein [Planctomycetota bacterium]